MEWIALLAAIVTAVAGQILLKIGAGAPTIAQQALDWRTWAGLVCYGGSAMAYIVALRRIPVSVALPCTALSYFVVAGLGAVLLHEPMGVQKISGLVVIGVGVVLLATA